jgi:RNA polymerase sigma factor (sigma-70 family)
MSGSGAGQVLRSIRRIFGGDAEAGLTDRQLLEAFAARRDEDAFAALVRRHGPMVLGVCRRVLADAEDVDDAFQATFLVLVQKAGGLRRPELLGNWLYGVACRVAVNARANAARRRAHERRAAEIPRTVPADEGSLGDLRAVLDQELERLPHRYRTPVVLCYLEGKTNDQAAGELGWSRGTLAGRLHRARGLLRARLGRRGYALPEAALLALLPHDLAAPPVPPALASSAVRVGVLVAAGEAAPGASAGTLGLTAGVLRAMALTRATRAAAALLALGLLATGVGFVSYRALAAGQPAGPTVAAAPPRLAAAAPGDKAPESGPTFGEALAAARDIETPAERAPVLVRIAQAQARAGAGEAARKTLQEARAAADAIKDLRAHMAFREIAETYARLGDFEDALRTAGALKSELARDQILLLIAGHQASTGDLAGARKVMAAMTTDQKDDALAAIAGAQARAGDVKAALETADRLRHQPLSRADALEEIALAQAKAGDKTAAGRSLREALDLDVATLAEDDQKNAARARLAVARAGIGDVRGALEAAAALPGGDEDRDDAVRRIALEQAQAGDTRGALQTIETIKDPGRRAGALTALAGARADAGDGQAATAALEKAAEVAARAEDRSVRANLLAESAGVRTRLQMQAGDWKAAREAARALTGRPRAALLLEIVRAQVQAKQPAEARATLKDVLPLLAALGDDKKDPMGVQTLAPQWVLFKGHYAREATHILAELGQGREGAAWAARQEPPYVKAMALLGAAEGQTPPKKDEGRNDE